jgi:DNA-binding SARP family transcriptional activator
VTVEFRLLGAIEAADDGRPVDLGHVRQRSVLAVLLIEANTPVSAEALADRIWGARPPQRAAATVYSYLSRLRRSLSQLDGVELARRAGGYVLGIDPIAVDLHRFRRLVGAARAAEGEPALALLDEALGLWRGEPFAGLDTVWLDRERETALSERLAAELDRADLALAIGRHAELLGELRARAEAQPLDERIAGQLMIALYRSGRQAEALDRFDSVRRRLAEELGADPGALLRGIHRQILTADPAIAAGPPTAQAGALVPAWFTVPRQLPAPPSTFTGRGDQLAELDRAMAPGPDRGATVVISAIGGSGGIGKTWLALHWAHRNIERFSDGQLYINLRGFDPTGGPLPPEVVVRTFLESLGVPATAVPAHLDAQTALYRSVTAGKRMLIVLDNARDSAQVIPLLPGSPSCTVLVTSRHSLGTLVAAHGARPVMVDVLTDGEARELLRRQLGEHRLGAEPDAADALIQHCAGLPLALGIVAARATLAPDLPLAELAVQLHDTATRLDALDAGELTANLRAVLAGSHDALGRDAARLFVVLGLAPGPDIGLRAVASLAATPVGQVRGRLNELVHAHLVQPSALDRYRMHDLVHLYASEQARSAAVSPQEVTHRVLDHYLHSADIANALLSPGRGSLPLSTPRPGVVPDSLTDHSAALAWFAAERTVLVRTVEHAAAQGFDRHAWQIAWCATMFLSRREHWHDLLTIHRLALAAAQRLDDPLALTHAHRGLGSAHVGLREYELAYTHLSKALEFAVVVDDPVCQAHAHRGLGRLHAKQAQFQEALPHDERALELFRTAGNQVGQANALNAVGWHLAHLGQPRRAVTCCRQALALYERLGDRHGQALTWDSLGYARLLLGQQRDSAGCYRRAVDLLRELGHRNLQAGTLVDLGAVLVHVGDRDGAVTAWREALRIFEELGDPAADAVRGRLSAVGWPTHGGGRTADGTDRTAQAQPAR